MDASLEQRIADVFSSRTDVMAVYLFGSTARGTARAGSDIDVAVLFDAPPPGTLSGPRFVIEGELERALGTPVDLVVLNDAPVDLRTRVLRAGTLRGGRRDVRGGGLGLLLVTQASKFIDYEWTRQSKNHLTVNIALADAASATAA